MSVVVVRSRGGSWTRWSSGEGLGARLGVVRSKGKEAPGHRPPPGKGVADSKVRLSSSSSCGRTDGGRIAHRGHFLTACALAPTQGPLLGKDKSWILAMSGPR